MRIVHVTSLAEMYSLEPQWDALLATSSAASVFLTCGWMAAWWEAYGETNPDMQLSIVTCYHNNTLVGIAPICIHEKKVARLIPLIQCRFLSSQEVPSDFLDFIITKGLEDKVLPAMLSAISSHCLSSRPRAIKRFLINAIKSSSPSIPIIQEWAKSRRLTTHQTEAEICPYVPIVDSWEAHQEKMDPKFAKCILKDAHKAQNKSIEFTIDIPEKDHRATLESLIELHNERWHEEGRSGEFASKKSQQFYTLLITKYNTQKRFFLASAVHNGTPIAVALWGIFGNKAVGIQAGCGSTGRKYHAGNVLVYYLVQYAVKQGYEFHFLRGPAPYKYKWGCKDHATSTLYIEGKTTHTCRNLLMRSPLSHSLHKSI